MEQDSGKAASPHTEAQDLAPPPTFTKDSPHTATSVDEEVEILGSQTVDLAKPSCWGKDNPVPLEAGNETRQDDQNVKMGLSDGLGYAGGP